MAKGNNILNYISLFTGVLGMDLAAMWAGFNPLLFCEIDKYCQQIIKQHFPNIPLIEDVKNVKGKQINQPIKLIIGGFPCQDVSLAGKRQGINNATRSGLWGEYARIIGEFRPEWALVENVPGLLSVDNGGDYEEYSGTLPNWGTMQNGVLYELVISGQFMDEDESLLLPTPTAMEWKDVGYCVTLSRIDKGGRVARRICSTRKNLPKDIRVKVNQNFLEQMMGLPIGWTELKLAGTQ